MNNECENYCEQMEFPNTFEEFLSEYSFVDKEEIYTNKNELIQTFRVEQGYKHFEKIIRADERAKTICEIQNKLKNDYHGMLSDESMKIYEFINYLEEMKEGAE